MPSHTRRHLIALMLLTSLCAALPCELLAQDPPSTLKVLPPDLGYERNVHKTEKNRILDFQRGSAPVDQRIKHDPMATQGVLFPSAYIPPDHQLIYRNHMILGHQLSYAWNSRLMFTAGWFEPLESSDWEMQNIDDMLTATLSVSLWKSQDLQVSFGTSLISRTGQRFMDSEEQGVSLNLTSDIVLTDWLVLGLGVMGYAPWRVNYDTYDTSQCKSRVEFLNRSCFRPQTIERSWPKGGRWWQLYGQLTFYGPRGFFGKLELNSGQRVGTILNLEGAVYGNDDPLVQQKRYESTDATWGSLFGVPLNVQFALGWTYRYIGFQTGFVILPPGNLRQDRHGRDSDSLRRQYLALLPVLSMGIRWP